MNDVPRLFPRVADKQLLEESARFNRYMASLESVLKEIETTFNHNFVAFNERLDKIEKSLEELKKTVEWMNGRSG